MFPTAKIEGLRKITLCVFLGPTLYVHGLNTAIAPPPYPPTPLPPPPQKKNKFCISIVFNNKGYAKFRRAKNVQYGRCACKWRIQTSNAICEKKYEIAACVINLWG